MACTQGVLTFNVRRVFGLIRRISALSRQWFCPGNSYGSYVPLSGRLDLHRITRTSTFTG